MLEKVERLEMVVDSDVYRGLYNLESGIVYGSYGCGLGREDG